MEHFLLFYYKCTLESLTDLLASTYWATTHNHIAIMGMEPFPRPMLFDISMRMDKREVDWKALNNILTFNKKLEIKKRSQPIYNLQ